MSEGPAASTIRPQLQVDNDPCGVLAVGCSMFSFVLLFMGLRRCRQLVQPVVALALLA